MAKKNERSVEIVFMFPISVCKYLGTCSLPFLTQLAQDV